MKVSLTLSDAFCVARFRDEFLELAEKYVDILFANESEILSLYQTEDFDEALQQVRKHCEIAALTRSEKGSVVVNGDEVHVIDAVQGRQGRGYDRRRRCVCRRVPLRLHAGTRSGDVRAGSAARWRRR